MKIAFTISTLAAGGAERVASELVRHWSDASHDVTLITLDQEGTKPFYNIPESVSIIQLNQTRRPVRPWSFIFRALRRIYLLRRTINNIKPDVIVSFIDIMNITTLIASLGISIPVVVSERTHPKYHKIGVFYSALRRLLYKIAHKVIVQTESAASYFDFLNNVSVIPNPCKVPKLEYQPNDYAITRIISVGRLCYYKGFDVLIKAFAELIGQYPELSLTIYGNDPYRKQLEELIQSLNLETKITLPGHVVDVTSALVDANLFVFPSRYEGFPNALAEAMAVGLPVIASNCSGNIDLVQDKINGRLFEVDDVNTLIRLLQELITDPKQCAMLSKQAKQITKRFSAETVFAQWDAQINKSL